MTGHAPVASAFDHDLPAPPPSQPGRKAYQEARRHSGIVRVLKIAIPLGSLAAIGCVLAATYLNPLGRVAGLSLGTLSLSGTKVMMESPRLTGYRKDSKPYEVTARAAFQDIRKPGLIELKDMKAKLATDDAGSVANLVATGGLFDTSREHLDLRDDIRITTTRGDEVLLRSAAIDFKGGTVVSTDPVRITTQDGVIEAEGVKVSDNGHTIVFTGRVRTQFSRSLTEAAAPDSPKVSQAEAARP